MVIDAGIANALSEGEPRGKVTGRDDAPACLGPGKLKGKLQQRHVSVHGKLFLGLDILPQLRILPLGKL